MHFENVKKKKKGENAGYEHFGLSPSPVPFTDLSDTSPFINARVFCMNAKYGLV